jgi:MFS family permease
LKDDSDAFDSDPSRAGSTPSATGAVAPEAKGPRLAFMMRALRHRNYRLFFSGQLVSLLGSWMTQIATTWLVYRLTGSPLMLGAVGFAGQIPAFLLSPVAGVWVDRLPRHRLLVVTQVLAMLQSLGLAFLTLTGHIDIRHIVVLMIFQGLINAFDMPARQAFVIELVEDKADLSNAIALNSSMFNIARLLGPSIGGLLIAAVGEGWCFLIDGVSYIGVIGCLLAMRVPKFEKLEHEAPLQQLVEGWRYAFGFPPIRSILLLMAGMSMVAMPYAVLMPVVAAKVLHGGPSTLGWLMAASGLGALTGALRLAARDSVRGLGKLIPLCTVGFGVAVLIFSHSHWLWLSLPAMLVMGYAMMTQNASCNTILQTIVEPDKRGRVMSLYTMAFMGMMPLGSLWAGALAEHIGAPNTLLISGVGCLVIAFWFGRNLPGLAQHVRPIYLKLGIIPEVAAGLGETTEISRLPQEKPKGRRHKRQNN